ncbi:MAG: phosphate signaling complex protein PhoU [Elusimicrobiota bacterium]|jgi:phosphate transport system protein|nr:phosphate signaling complex protein PhoU [Elusimicrobiota bacterium]
MIEQKMQELKVMIIEYATFIEDMVSKSIYGYIKKEKELLKKVIEINEKKANKYEIDIEKFCTYFLAQYDPKAIDLRTILMILKINNDLERIADHAVNIGESALYLIDNPQIEVPDILKKNAENVVDMLNLAIKSFINQDIKLAETIEKKDDIIDAYHRDTLEQVIELMKNNSSIVKQSVNVIRISNNLERIADLITNIAEDIIYIFEAKITKHHYNDLEK